MLADGNFATHSRGRYRLIPNGQLIIMVHWQGRIVQHCVMSGVKLCRASSHARALVALSSQLLSPDQPALPVCQGGTSVAKQAV
jgi:hypothetical protein